MRVREAARALVCDPEGRVLLVRFEFPSGTRWALPGGGIEAGESACDALRRELREEIGLEVNTVGPHLFTRLHVFPSHDGRFDAQREEVFVVEVPAGFEPRPALSWEALRAEFVFELRWWSASALEAADVVTAPRALASLLARYRREGHAGAPWDVRD